MSFRFEFVGARHDRGDSNSLQPAPTLRLFGRLLEGRIHMGDPIVIATLHGEQIAEVSQFWDSLYDSGLMPFNETASLQNVSRPFCLVIHGFPGDLDPLCPSVAHSTNHPSPDKTEAITESCGINRVRDATHHL